MALYRPKGTEEKQPQQAQRPDWDEIDKTLAQDVESRCREWFSDKKIVKSGNWIKIGNQGSLSVNADDGHWNSFESEEKGPGLLSLYAWRYNVSLEQAAEDLQTNVVPFRATRPEPKKAEPVEQWHHPDIAPIDCPDSHFDNGKADHVYRYRTREGKAVGVVMRWDATETRGKDIRPKSWIQMRGKDEPEWKWCAFAEPRPLYRGERINQEPDKPILIVEGEKCVEAAEKHLHDWIVVSWPGGSSAINKADWSGLESRRVVIWPDNDDAGHSAAAAIKSYIPHLEIMETGDLPKKADIFDVIEEDGADIALEMIPPAKPVPTIERGMKNMPLTWEEAKSLRPEVIIEGLIYAGSKMLIGGVAKAGKSHFVMDLVASLAKGEKFLVWQPARKFSVLYVDFELHPFEMRERCGNAFNWNAPENFGRLSLRQFSQIRDPKSLGKLLQQIKAHDFEVIVLDCLYKFNQAEDENSNSAMKEIGVWLDWLVAEFDITPIVIHHFGKGSQGGKDIVDRFRGASSLVGDMDAMISITSHEDEDHLIVESSVRSFKQTDPFVVKWDYPNFIYDESKDASKYAKPGAKKRFDESGFLDQMKGVGAIGRANAMSINQIAKALECHKNTIKKAVENCKNVHDTTIKPGGQQTTGYYVD